MTGDSGAWDALIAHERAILRSELRLEILEELALVASTGRISAEQLRRAAAIERRHLSEISNAGRGPDCRDST